MSSFRKCLTIGTAVVVASLALASTAEARHRHVVMRVAAAAPILVPAHERPGFVHAVGPGLIDLGLGPVFPFGGWPAKL